MWAIENTYTLLKKKGKNQPTFKAGEMVQWLIALAALTKYLGSVLSSRRAGLNNHLYLEYLENKCAQTSGLLDCYMVHREMKAKTHTHKTNNINNIKDKGEHHWAPQFPC